MKIHLKIIDFDGIYLQSDVDLINIVTTSGELTILANHLPLIANIKISHMYTKNDGIIINYAIAGGVLFVSESECKIITNAIENEEEIDFTRANDAKLRAEDRLKSPNDNIDIKRAEIALQRALNRLSMK